MKVKLRSKGSRRQRPERGYTSLLHVNPYLAELNIVGTVHPQLHFYADTAQLDCGDVPVTPFDQAVAIKQVKAAYRSMLHHPVASPLRMEGLGMQKGLDGEYHPRIIALGGDHTIVRPQAPLHTCLMRSSGVTHPRCSSRSLRPSLRYPL